MASRPSNASALAGHIAGLREAKAAFQALPESFRTRSNEATETTVREIVRQAQARLQSNPSIDTRTLYKAIGWSLNKNNGRGRAGIQNVTSTIVFGHMGGISRKIKIKGVLIGAKNAQGAKLIKPTKYGPKVEFGTRHMAAEPFMIPAAKSQEQPYLDRMKRAGKDVERDVASIGMRGL